MREVVEPAEEVGRVGPAVGDDRGAAVSASDELGERAAALADVGRPGAEVDRPRPLDQGDVRQPGIGAVQLASGRSRAGARRITALRSRTVGTASRANGRSSAR